MALEHSSYDNVKEELRKHTGFSNIGVSESSLSDLLLRYVSTEMSRAENNVDNLISQHTIQGATGVYLDVFAAQYGVIRSRAQKASDRTGANVQISASNLAATFDIPAGTAVNPLEGESSSVTFETLSQITLTPDSFGDASGFVNVEAKGAGPEFNVANGVLQRISLVNAPTGAGFMVTNLASISNGRDTESDSDLRFRVGSKMAGRVPGTLLSLRSFLDSSHEVISYRIEELDGSVQILIQPRSVRDIGPTAAALQESLEDIVPLGTGIRIRLPLILVANVTVDVSFGGGISPGGGVFESSAENRIRRYIRMLVIEEALTVRAVEDLVTEHLSLRATVSRFDAIVQNVTATGHSTDFFATPTDEISAIEPYLIVEGLIQVNAAS